LGGGELVVLLLRVLVWSKNGGILANYFSEKGEFSPEMFFYCLLPSL
jgi:hypothetical protein